MEKREGWHDSGDANCSKFRSVVFGGFGEERIA
jgi:hypothetical protein